MSAFLTYNFCETVELFWQDIWLGLWELRTQSFTPISKRLDS